MLKNNDVGAKGNNAMIRSYEKPAHRVKCKEWAEGCPEELT